jgi:hypothetical protein
MKQRSRQDVGGRATASAVLILGLLFSDAAPASAHVPPVSRPDAGAPSLQHIRLADDTGPEPSVEVTLVREDGTAEEFTERPESPPVTVGQHACETWGVSWLGRTSPGCAMTDKAGSFTAQATWGASGVNTVAWSFRVNPALATKATTPASEVASAYNYVLKDHRVGSRLPYSDVHTVPATYWFHSNIPNLNKKGAFQLQANIDFNMNKTAVKIRVRFSFYFVEL